MPAFYCFFVFMQRLQFFQFRCQIPQVVIIFDESINRQIGFSINQNDRLLSDKFNKTVDPPKSELCGPTTVANLMALYKLTDSAVSKMLSLTFSPERPDYVNEVREYINSCKTDLVSGTTIVNLSDCISQTFSGSGILNSEVKVIGPEMYPGLDPKFATSNRVIGVNDIKEAIKNGYAVIMQIKWFQPIENANQITWVTTSGHFVLIVGYDYDQTFGDQKIILKVVNPEVDYNDA